MRTTHELKTDPEVFDAVADGRKTFEIRKNDRGFNVGDILRLRRTRHTGAEMATGSGLVYTGEEVFVTVTHILRGPIYGLEDGWCIMSVAKPSPTLSREAAERIARLFIAETPWNHLQRTRDASECVDAILAAAQDESRGA